jgi:hypothetical protein
LHRDKSTGKGAQKGRRNQRRRIPPPSLERGKEINDKTPFLSFGGKIKNPS